MKIARIRIELMDMEPMVSREVEVPVAMKLHHFHEVIMYCMSWGDDHLHEFVSGGQSWGHSEFRSYDHDSVDCTLADMLDAAGV